MVVSVLLGLSGPAMAKSLYLIASQDSELTSRLQAYSVNTDGTLTYQATYTPAGNNAVGLALDNASNTLFVSTEFSGYLTVVDAQTMTSLGAPVLAPGATNLAGIVMDEKQQLLYAVDRVTNQLYVYAWDATAKTLTLQAGSPHTLAGVVDPAYSYSGAYGIALDKINHVLYVANATPIIHKFNTGDWSSAGTLQDPGSFNIAISVAVDSRNQKLYTGAGFANDSYLKQYNLTTGAVKMVQITGARGIVDYGVIGLDADENTGDVYISTSYLTNELQVFDSSLTKIQTAGYSLNGAAGLVIGAGYNPLNLDKKASPNLVRPGSNITYTITCDNRLNPQQVTNVTIQDPLPAATTFLSASGGGVYDPATNTVTWNLGTLPAGALPVSFQLLAQVKPGTLAPTVTNSATISSTETGTSSPKSATTMVWGMAFPLPGFTPSTAPVSAVMDNSVLERTPIQFYVPGDVIKAFDGETGYKQYGVKYMDPYGLYWPAYKNSGGSDFFPPSAGVRLLNYLNGPYLSYAGIPATTTRCPRVPRYWPPPTASFIKP